MAQTTLQILRSDRRMATNDVRDAKIALRVMLERCEVKPTLDDIAAARTLAGELSYRLSVLETVTRYIEEKRA